MLQMWTFIFLGASDEVQKQVVKNVINCFTMLRTGSVFGNRENSKGKQLVAGKAPSGITSRVSITKVLCNKIHPSFSSDI